MYKATLPLFLMLVLSSCHPGPIDILYKEGSTRAQRQEVYDQCLIKGLRDVPQNMVTEVSGGENVPGYVKCKTDDDRTICGEVGGYTTPITSSSFDTNKQLRDRVISRCLNGGGYGTIVRPICETKAERNAYAMLTTQPNESQIACVSGQSFNPN